MQRTTVGSLLRSTQAFCGQLCEKETLDYGIAYYCPRFPDLAEVNQFREVIVQDPEKLPAAFEEADRFFAAKNLVCRRWAPAEGSASAEMTAFLESKGFRKQQFAAMAAVHWMEAPEPHDVRVLPARALRAAFRETFLRSPEPDTPAQREALADAYSERMDDPSFEMFVAMAGKEPAGRCALYQVGDIARVMDLHVLPGFADHSVHVALLWHVLSLAKRLAMRNICALIEEEDGVRREWFRDAGFIEDGAITEFQRTAE